MPPIEHRAPRRALLVDFNRNETPSPVEWVAVPDPNPRAPAPGQTFLEWLKELCNCECVSDRNNETPKCVIN